MLLLNVDIQEIIYNLAFLQTVLRIIFYSMFNCNLAGTTVKKLPSEGRGDLFGITYTPKIDNT